MNLYLAGRGPPGEPTTKGETIPSPVPAGPVGCVSCVPTQVRAPSGEATPVQPQRATLAPEGDHDLLFSVVALHCVILSLQRRWPP
jgi:hypothetical protein